MIAFRDRGGFGFPAVFTGTDLCSFFQTGGALRDGPLTVVVSLRSGNFLFFLVSAVLAGVYHNPGLFTGGFLFDRKAVEMVIRFIDPDGVAPVDPSAEKAALILHAVFGAGCLALHIITSAYGGMKTLTQCRLRQQDGQDDYRQDDDPILLHFRIPHIQFQNAGSYS